VSGEQPVRLADLRVGDLIKSYVDFIPPWTVTSRPLPRQSGFVDYETTRGHSTGHQDDTVTVLERAS
jgi:hypothetical protein